MSIECAILGLLSKHPYSGYDLKKIMEKSDFMPWSGNNNQIYKALVTLLNEGYVTTKTVHNDGSPSKKIYQVTTNGLDKLQKWIKSAPGVPDFKNPFLVQLLFADQLEHPALMELLQAYENEIRLRIALHNEKRKRETGAAPVTRLQGLLTESIHDNILSAYQSELLWICKLQLTLSEPIHSNKENKMNYIVNEQNNQKYLELFSAQAPIATEQDAVDIAALCWENNTERIIIQEQALSEDFFRLKTGVAGGILQKLTNYHIKTAFLISPEKVNTGKFKDMAAESSRSNQFRIFEDKETAKQWLLA
ncbi:MAG: hypothetical protein BGN88_04105 [Clostridiales bacterium 43-6]|nr:MAG: hypothetical protein BGN88_04105 [Clostridiales bacterium 43-6]